MRQDIFRIKSFRVHIFSILYNIAKKMVNLKDPFSTWYRLSPKKQYVKLAHFMLNLYETFLSNYSIMSSCRNIVVATSHYRGQVLKASLYLWMADDSFTKLLGQARLLFQNPLWGNLHFLKNEEKNVST